MRASRAMAVVLVAAVAAVCLPDAECDTIYIAFGDSITKGGSSSGYGYEDELEALLNAKFGADSQNVVTRAKGGEETDDGADRLPGVLRDVDDADYILIMEGTNDVGSGREPHDIADNIEDMIDTAQDAGLIVVLGTVIPRFDFRNSWIQSLNDDYLKDMAMEKGVALADQYACFTAFDDPEDELYEDDKHPNRDGYDVMAQCWFDAIVVEDAPAGVVGSAGDTTAEITWDVSTDPDVDRYNVYRRTEGMGYTRANSTRITEGSFLDEGLENGITYFFVVTSVDGSGNESEFSVAITVIPDAGGDGGCFIATAAHGTALAPEVQVLCDFRDSYLLSSEPGRALVDAYYRLGPPLAERLGRHPALKAAVRTALMPVVGAARAAVEKGSDEL